MSPSIETLLIDLDDTLYPPDNGVWRLISSRIDAYMTEKIGLTPEQARRHRASYLQAQGTTLKGLMDDFHIEPTDYLDFVHQIDYAAMIHFDPELRRTLESLPQHKYVFTNASAAHARNVLGALRLSDLFSGIIDIVALDYANKPDLIAYKRALELAGSPSPEASLLADDRIVNLKPARALGMTTVLVGSIGSDQVDIQIDRLADLAHALPSLLGDIHPSDDGHG